MTETYEFPVDDPDIDAGEYRLEATLSVSWGDDIDARDRGDESSPYPFVVTLWVPASALE